MRKGLYLFLFTCILLPVGIASAAAIIQSWTGSLRK